MAKKRKEPVAFFSEGLVQDIVLSLLKSMGIEMESDEKPKKPRKGRKEQA